MVTRYTNSLKLRDMPLSYTVVDLETTGVDPTHDAIIEISALRITNGAESGSFSTLVACSRPIPKAASDINGITKEMLKGAPDCRDAIASLINFVGCDVLMGHNANRFDRLFLEHEVAKCGDMSLENEWIDTVEMARKLYPGERVSLDALCSKFGVENEKAHRALSDCRATHECYLAMRSEALSITTEAAAFAPIDGKPVDGSLSGQSIVFTGESDAISRHDLMQMAVDHGAAVQDRTTLKTTLVVSVDGSESKKTKKAREYSERTGVRIVSLDDFLGLADGKPLREPQPTSAHEEPAAKVAVADATPRQAEGRRAARPKRRLVLVAVAVLLVLIGAVGTSSGVSHGDPGETLLAVAFVALGVLAWVKSKRR